MPAGLGVTLVRIAGGVDLSVGAIISLAAVLMEGSAANPPWALAAMLLVGGAIGLANGLLIACNRSRRPS